MPSSYTTSLRLTLPATGELAGQWGNTVNTGITELLDAAVAGTTAISTWGGAGVAYTLSNNSGATDEARRMFIVATGTPGEAKNVICPAVSKLYVFRNDTTGGFALTLKTPSGTGIAVPAGQYKVLYCNGTNVVEAFNSLASLTLGTALAASSGGTGQSSYTAGDLIYATGTTALSKLGIGTNGQILTSTGTAPQWSTLSGVAVTTFSAGTTGFTPSSATSGAVTLAGTLATTNGGTGLTSFTSGGVVYASSSSALTTGSALAFDGLNAFAMGSGGSANTATSFTLNATDNAANGSYIVGKRNGTNAWLIGDTASGLGSGTGFLSYNYGTAPWIWFLQTGGEQMRLTSTGLGIGTSSPGNKLDVNGVIRARGDIFAMSSGDRIQLLPQSAGNGGIIATADSTFSAYSPMTLDASYHVFRPNGTEAMRLTSTGLGIGTSVPGLKLDVAGGGNAVRVRTDGSAIGRLQFTDSGATTDYAYIGTPAANTLAFWTNGLTERMRLDASGNLGIGTSAPSYKLVVSNGGASGIEFGPGFSGTSNLIQSYNRSGAAYVNTVYDAAEHRFNISGSERMRLDASGNLGLGVTPSAWASNYRVLQMRESYATLASDNGNGVAELTSNAYNDGSWRYANSSVGAVRYQANAVNRTHAWFNAPSGTAGNAITFTQAMTLDASGRLGIGNTSPTGKLTVTDGTNRTVLITTDATQLGTSGMCIGGFNDNATTYVPLSLIGSTLQFGTGGIERARIDSSGNLLVNQTGSGPLNLNGVCIGPGNTGGTDYNHANGTASGVMYERFNYNATTIGSITQSGTTAVLFNTTSDARLKTNIVDAPDAAALIDSIKVRSFDWVSDESHQRYGMVAQELVQVAPEAVHQPEDPDEMMAVDYSKLVPMLIKEIQSLRARMAALEAQP